MPQSTAGGNAPGDCRDSWVARRLLAHVSRSWLFCNEQMHNWVSQFPPCRARSGKVFLSLSLSLFSRLENVPLSWESQLKRLLLSKLFDFILLSIRGLTPVNRLRSVRPSQKFVRTTGLVSSLWFQPKVICLLEFAAKDRPQMVKCWKASAR